MNFRLNIRAIILFSFMFLGIIAKAEEPVGVRMLMADASERTEQINMTLWYPADSGGELVKIGENAVFKGTLGRQDAPISEGRYPTILISLGGMRAAPNLASWIGADLAARGMIAVVVNPPRLRPSDAQIAIDEVWKRPADLTAALSVLEMDAEWSERIDTDKIAAVGFFLGGTSVLSLAGAQFDAESYFQSCDEGGTGIDCAWFAKAGVSLRDIDTAKLKRSHLDPRVKAAVIIDPELAESFSAESLAYISAPINIINLGHAETIAPGLNGSVLATNGKNANYTTLETATQFSAFSVCQPKGAAILAEDGGSKEICNSDADVGRESIHAKLAEMIAGYLENNLEK